MTMDLNYWITILLIFNTGKVLNSEITSEKEDENKTTDTDIAQGRDDRLLLFATLDGMLTAIEQQTGRVRWKIKDNPIVQVPLDITNAMVPIFLPDPRDGSLYLLDNSKEPLKKLPFTIPQLVSSSPCRSSNGVLYTGKKKDTWFKLDPVTGNKQQIFHWRNQSGTCPVDPKTFVYVGRAKYNIKMINSKNPENKWNVTFFDFAATPMNKEDLSSYDLVHFTSASSGKVITFNRRRGNLLWNGDLNSPIIRIYLIDQDGLISVPFTSMADYTITYLLTRLLTHNGYLQNLNQMKLYPTLYIGEHMYGLYATTSLVDRNGVTLTVSDTRPLLLGGPQESDKSIIYPEYLIPGHNYQLTKDFIHEGFTFDNVQSLPTFGKRGIFTGHYNVPQIGDQSFMEPSKGLKQITDESSFSQDIVVDHIKDAKEQRYSTSIQAKLSRHHTFDRSSTRNFVINLYQRIKFWINQQENILKLAIIALTGCIIAMIWYLQMQVHQGSHGHFISLSEELPNGNVRVGKISFHPGQLLGKGCDGTFVYRGEFDNRQVAVKRLLPECFTFADREVSLLRESDAHPHVIRYFCMEQDRMFRYIALELCQATLSDYIEGKCNITTIRPLDILQQATMGLLHLHSLDIVHRDIKPHNVLLSIPNNRGEVRAMISDFGLCKKLQVGKISFSRRSGVTGTDGWIAPEMLNGTERTTYAVDIFSLGCLYYYVLSNGYHPFGDSLRRQANILKGDYNLSKLRGAEWQLNIQKPLLSALIHSIPQKRPSCKAILQHPMFWNCSKILSFFQDVSDRVEKAATDDFVLRALENNRKQIVRMNWKLHIDEEVVSDLRKYRSYHGESIRDLLRAMRNKKHHFGELSEEAQKALGELPEGFTHYWTNRFPLLLTHTWITMQRVANEKVFRNYYHETHRYSTNYYKEQLNLPTDMCPLNNMCSGITTNDFSLFTTHKKKNNLKMTRIVPDQFETAEIKQKPREHLYRNLFSPRKVEDTMKKNVYKLNIIKKNRRFKNTDEPVTWVPSTK